MKLEPNYKILAKPKQAVIFEIHFYSVNLSSVKKVSMSTYINYSGVDKISVYVL